MVDEQKLRQLAEAATPGPWITEDWAATDSDGAINVCGTSVMAPQALCGIFTVALEGDGTEDVDYIAAANPAAILALLDEFQTLRVTAENAEKDAAKWKALCCSQQVGHTHKCKACIFSYTPDGEDENCPVCGSDGADAAIDAEMKGES